MGNHIDLSLKPKNSTDWEDLAEIFKAVLGPRDPGKLKAAFESTPCRQLAYNGERIVGAGRIITDGLYYGLLVDVVVAADLQRVGVGAKLVKALVAVARVPLIVAQSVPAVKPFYLHLGFKQMLTGVAYVQDPETAIKSGYLEA